jgi:hypothetical protein
LYPSYYRKAARQTDGSRFVVITQHEYELLKACKAYLELDFNIIEESSD